MFSTTENESISPRSWWTTERPYRLTLAGRTGSPTGWPSINNEPPGSGPWYPDRTLTRVDFPDPFSPTRPWISPGATVIETSFRARFAPKLFDRSRSSSRAVDGASSTGATSVSMGVSVSACSVPMAWLGVMLSVLTGVVTGQDAPNAVHYTEHYSILRTDCSAGRARVWVLARPSTEESRLARSGGASLFHG